MQLLLQKFNNFRKQRFVKYGIPFFIVIFGGSFGLREFAQLRYEFSRVSPVRPEELEKHGISMKKPGEVTLETEFEKIKEVDIDNWEQVRGPRPWEEDTMKRQPKQQ